MFSVRVLLPVFCVLLIVAIMHDAFEVMLAGEKQGPHRPLFFEATWSLWSSIGRRLVTEQRRSNFLALYGPLSPVLILFVWACGLIIGFSGFFAAVETPQFTIQSWFNQAYFSGRSTQ